MKFFRDKYYVPFFIFDIMLMICNVSDLLDPTMYVDDTILLHADVYITFFDNANVELQKISLWFTSNKSFLTVILKNTHFFHELYNKNTIICWFFRN